MSAIVGDGTALTEKGSVNGSELGSYTLPLLGTFRVESVVAAIDGTAAGDVKPVLRVRDKSGAVIATKRQSDVIPAGDTGSATWALRLVDEAPAPAPPPAPSGLEFTANGVYGPANSGDGLNVTTTTGTGVNFNTGPGNFFIQAGGGTTLAIFSPVISMQAGSASFGIGTSSPPIPAAGNDIDAGAANFRITLGTGGDGFKVIKKAAPHNPIFRVRNAGGSNSLDFYNQAGAPVLSAGIVAGPLDAVGFFGALSARPTIVGARGGNVALTNLLAALAAFGLIIDATTP